MDYLVNIFRALCSMLKSPHLGDIGKAGTCSTPRRRRGRSSSTEQRSKGGKVSARKMQLQASIAFVLSYAPLTSIERATGFKKTQLSCWFSKQHEMTQKTRVRMLESLGLNNPGESALSLIDTAIEARQNSIRLRKDAEAAIARLTKNKRRRKTPIRT
jgi:hypothetical protein